MSHGVEFSIYVRFCSPIGGIFPAMAAANAPPELASGNPCCVAVCICFFTHLSCLVVFSKESYFLLPLIVFQWQGKYIGMKKRRDAFREAVTLLQKAIADASAEKSNLEKSKFLLLLVD